MNNSDLKWKSNKDLKILSLVGHVKLYSNKYFYLKIEYSYE